MRSPSTPRSIQTAPLVACVFIACVLVPACTHSGGRTIQGRDSSGVVRLTIDSFGLLVNPCTRFTVSRVELEVFDLTTRSATVVLRETFDPPALPRTFIVSTDPDAPSSLPAARREVLEPELVRRFNEDRGFLTSREDEAEIGYVAFGRLARVALEDVRCIGSDDVVWTLPRAERQASPRILAPSSLSTTAAVRVFKLSWPR